MRFHLKHKVGRKAKNLSRKKTCCCCYLSGSVRQAGTVCEAVKELWRSTPLKIRAKNKFLEDFFQATRCH